MPGRTINVLERESKDYNVTFKLTGTTKEMINFASYNYLGFAQNEGPCADAVAVRLNSGRITGGRPCADDSCAGWRGAPRTR